MIFNLQTEEQAEDEGGAFRERVDQDMLVVGMGAAAARAQAVKSGDSQRGCEVAVAAAAGGSLGELEAERLGRCRRAFSKRDPLAGVRSIGGRLNDPRSRQADSRIDGPSAARAASIRVSSARVATRTSISAEACAGTTLVVVPPSNDADIDRGPGGQVLQVLRAEDLMSELDDRAATLLGRHAGMGGLAFDSRWNRPTPLREVLSPPSARAGSSTRA